MQEIKQKSDGQKAAENEVESFRDDLGPFVVAADTTRMAMVFTNAKESDNPIIFANDAFLHLTGYDREEVMGQEFRSLFADGLNDGAITESNKAFDSNADSSPEICILRKDKSKFWAAVFISPVRDDEGNIVQHFTSFVDVTKHKQEQEQSRMLIAELNHRVKNTLSTVQSIVAQALRKTSDPEAVGESIESRVFALSRSHDLLTRSGWKAAGLHDLLDATLEPFGVANGRKERFAIVGENVALTPRATLALGIAFHELATNAVKYGAFSNEVGSVEISWTPAPHPDGDRLILSWLERNGPPVSPPSRRGFGSQVIERGLGHELEASVLLEYRADGVACRIDMPAPGEAS